MLQLKITLSGSKPPIWRRVWISEGRPLEHLHYLIQTIMPWENSHLYNFNHNSLSYEKTMPNGDFDGDENVDDFQIVDLLREKGDKLIYTYDFGDWWQHSVVVEESGSPEIPHEPYVVTGKRDGPPEDCGGIPMYQHILDVLKKGKGSEYAHFSMLLGEGYDPDFFDIDLANEELAEFEGVIEEWKEMENDLLGL